MPYKEIETTTPEKKETMSRLSPFIFLLVMLASVCRSEDKTPSEGCCLNVYEAFVCDAETKEGLFPFIIRAPAATVPGNNVSAALVEQSTSSVFRVTFASMNNTNLTITIRKNGYYDLEVKVPTYKHDHYLAGTIRTTLMLKPGKSDTSTNLLEKVNK